MLDVCPYVWVRRKHSKPQRPRGSEGTQATSSACVFQVHSCPILSRMCPIRDSSKAYPDNSNLKKNDTRRRRSYLLVSFVIIASLHYSQILLHYLPNSFSCHQLFKHVFLNLHTFVNLPVFHFLLISSFIALGSEDKNIGMILLFLRLLRLVLWNSERWLID